MLADEAMPVKDIDRAEVEAALNGLRDDLVDAKEDAERQAVDARIAVAEAKLAALGA